MEILVPQAELRPIAERYGDPGIDFDRLPALVVRAYADRCGQGMPCSYRRSQAELDKFRAMADELDALVDRLELEARTTGSNPGGAS